MFNVFSASHLHLKSFVIFRQSTFQKIHANWQPRESVGNSLRLRRASGWWFWTKEGILDKFKVRVRCCTMATGLQRGRKSHAPVVAPPLKNWVGGNFLVLGSRRVKINCFPLAPISGERDSTVLLLLRISFTRYWHPGLREEARDRSTGQALRKGGVYF